eukprot:scaffold36515_cov27-Tisochrysis_lutea.AAC.1
MSTPSKPTSNDRATVAARVIASLRRASHATVSSWQLRPHALTPTLVLAVLGDVSSVARDEPIATGPKSQARGILPCVEKRTKCGIGSPSPTQSWLTRSQALLMRSGSESRSSQCTCSPTQYALKMRPPCATYSWSNMGAGKPRSAAYSRPTASWCDLGGPHATSGLQMIGRRSPASCAAAAASCPS